MKKKILLLILAMTLITFTGCGKKESDAVKFKEEYTKVSEDNKFAYRNVNEIIKILENGTGIVYLGFKECPWCQAYVPMLDEVAKENNLEKVYYFNILESRKQNTSEYQKIVSILKDYLQYDDEGNKRVYVPAVIAVVKGNIVGFDDETSLDTNGLDNPTDYWTEEKIANLKTRLTTMANQVKNAECSDCN